MLLIQPAETRVLSYWNILEGLGCSYESMHIDQSIGRRLLYSVDVPPMTDIHEVYEVLERVKIKACGCFSKATHISRNRDLRFNKHSKRSKTVARMSKAKSGAITSMVTPAFRFAPCGLLATRISASTKSIHS